MTLVIYPMQDGYETVLSQTWAGGTGSVYVRTAPSFTMPASTYCIVTVDPGTDKEQAFIMDSFNTSAKTLNCYSISVNKGPSLAYTQQTHSVGAKVIISDNYAFWEAIKTALDAKVYANLDGLYFGYFASKAARDASFTSPVNGKYFATALSEGVFSYYLGGAWIDIPISSTSTTNASTTVAGKVEVATQAENTAGTNAGGTGAILSTPPDVMATTIQRGERLYAGASAAGTDTYAVSMTPALAAYTTGMRLSFLTDVANTGACTINVNSLGAKSIKLVDGTDPLDGDLPATKLINLQYDGTNFVYQNVLIRSTAAQANTGTDTKTVITPNLLIYAGSTPTAGTSVLVASYATQVNQQGTTYTQKFIGTILRTGTYTVAFDMKWQDGGSGGGAYARVYKNGVAFGTEQTTTSVSDVNKTEDLAFTAGDTISLWLKAGVAGASDTAYVNDFTVKCNQLHFTIA